MTYLESVTNSYREAMMDCGISGDVLNHLLYAFETGFNAGTLYHSDIELQKDMVKSILNEDNLM